MDDLDTRLIALLRNDARLPVAKLAAALAVSRATVTARMARLEASGIILGYTAVLRRQEEGAGVRAMMLVEVDGKHAELVIRRLSGLPEIVSLHTTNGRWDIVAEIEAATLSAFDTLLRTVRQIDGISTTETNILLAARKSGRA
ncbi:MAG: Lrp/AsnC family transcriptional regulator [Rhizobiaceae bacterium]|nr:Lrp/AsnC family transcriptional regulator [Rhizobiaceae bacterium]